MTIVSSVSPFMVPVVGLEPTRCLHQRILSPPRLPFQHTGKVILTPWSIPPRKLGGICRRDIKLTYFIIHKKWSNRNHFFPGRENWRSTFWVRYVYHFITPAWCLYSIVYFFRNCKKKFCRNEENQKLLDLWDAKTHNIYVIHFFAVMLVFRRKEEGFCE